MPNNDEFCKKCGRIIQGKFAPEWHTGDECKFAYAYLVHDGFGCDTGCCGHRLFACDDSGKVLDNVFEFTHADKWCNDVANNEDARLWCEAVISVHWPNIPIRYDLCSISDD